MLGWQIYIHRQLPGQSPDKPTEESLLATWVAGLGGLDWLDELVTAGRAVDLGGNGYPCRYTALAGDILPKIASGPPPHSGPLVIGEGDEDEEAYVSPGGWVGHVSIDHAKIAACSPHEQLIIEAWDQS